MPNPKVSPLGWPEYVRRQQVMSKFQSSKKIAIRCENEQFESLKQAAVSLWGAAERYAEPGVSALTMNDGTVLELYAGFAGYPEYLFKNSNVVISIRVDDLKQALDLAVGQGLKDLTGIVPVCSTLSYCHLELAGGTIIGLYQEGGLI